MRYINLENIKLPEGWVERSEQAFHDVEHLSGDARTKAINARATVWQELKKCLEDLSINKCWYCESIQDRSDNAVDHFRPKSKYWWLAFKSTNYRFSCTYCNSRRKDAESGTYGGKQDEFPLLDPTKTATYPDGDTTDEMPCLLDPTVVTDPGLLWFEPDGRVVAKFTGPEDDRLKLRAETSIELYHLSHHKIQRRRNHLYLTIKRDIDRGERYWQKMKRGDSTAETALSEIKGNLATMIAPGAAYSVAAKTFIWNFTKTHEWVCDVFITQ